MKKSFDGPMMVNRHSMTEKGEFNHLKVELRPLQRPNGEVVDDLFEDRKSVV